MSIHQQLWSLECSVIETVASLLRGMTEHCLAWTRSHCPDKVDDIQAVRKSSTDQCIFFCGSMKKIPVFPFQETPTLTLTFHLNGCTIRDPDSRNSHHLFRESGSRMVQPFRWNVNLNVGVSWNGKTDIFYPHKTKVDQNCYWKRLHAVTKQNGGAIQHIFR